MLRLLAVLCLIFPLPGAGALAATFAVTMDDPHVRPMPLMSAKERDARIRRVLAKRGLRAALFVSGKNVDSPAGRDLLKKWDRAGHIIANHSYSHWNLNARDTPLAAYRDDVLHGERLIAGLSGFHRFLRFPFLKEGGTPEKRDGMRAFMRDHGYHNGSVTIDASDWYVDQRLVARLETDRNADLRPYRDFYLRHMLRRAAYYEDLSQRVLGHSVKHTLLIHHTLLNALFLDDLLEHFGKSGWRAIGADEAFADPVFREEPKTLPAGESLIWSLAKASGRFEGELRYPGEDARYESEEMDRLGL